MSEPCVMQAAAESLQQAQDSAQELAVQVQDLTSGALLLLTPVSHHEDHGSLLHYTTCCGARAEVQAADSHASSSPYLCSLQISGALGLLQACIPLQCSAVCSAGKSALERRLSEALRAATAADEQHQQDSETWQARLQQATVSASASTWACLWLQPALAACTVQGHVIVCAAAVLAHHG